MKKSVYDDVITEHYEWCLKKRGKLNYSLSEIRLFCVDIEKFRRSKPFESIYNLSLGAWSRPVDSPCIQSKYHTEHGQRNAYSVGWADIITSPVHITDQYNSVSIAACYRYGKWRQFLINRVWHIYTNNVIFILDVRYTHIWIYATPNVSPTWVGILAYNVPRSS